MVNNEGIASVKAAFNQLSGGVKVSVYDTVGVIVEGHKGVLFFDENSVIFRRKRGTISLNGERMKIDEITDGDAYVSGDIHSVTYEVKLREVND